MRYSIHRPNLPFTAVAVTMIGIATAVVVVLLVYTSPAIANHSCSGTRIIHINPGNDLDAIVNADSSTRATTFCVHSGTYTIDRTVTLRSGDQIQGQPGGTPTSVGPASKPVPPVQVTAGANNVNELIRANGSNIQVMWLDLSGATGKYSNGAPVAGSGTAIAAGTANGTFQARYLRVHNNDGAGITNMKGRVFDSEFFSNTEDVNFLGFIGSAVKGVTEFEAARNFVHDEQGNGIWLDLGTNDPARKNGYWVHHNLVVNNARAAIRYENSPPGLADGVHLSEITALIEHNEVYGNSSEAPLAPRPISIRNSQNAVVRANVFGGATIDGVEYPPNSQNVAVRAGDAGLPDRTDLWNVDIIDNILNGESIVLSTTRGETLACGELPDEMVYCANNNP